MFQKIMEIKNFREALKEIHFDTWFVLDLDNTVMTPRISLGGDAWFEGLFSHIEQKKIESIVAKSSLMSVYNTAQNFVRTSPVEPAIVIIIKALQDIGIPVIGLTARGYSIRQQTLRQLADIEIDFSRNSVVPDDDSFCYGGVIFCGGGDKGEKFSSFFNPQHVVMLDDKKKHLERMISALQPLGVSFSGLRYGYLDEEVKQFSMETANIQLAQLWEWLSVTVQEDIRNLQLLSEDHLGMLDPLNDTKSFFHPNQPLHPVKSKSNLNNPSQVEQPKLLKRTISTASFFYENNQTNLISPLKIEQNYKMNVSI
ncbi:MAG: DUF2608 domain-containing protein [Legionella longbeachae]|nr:DUF2608 domain-containing protein [Legionella longbeachae]